MCVVAAAPPAGAGACLHRPWSHAVRHGRTGPAARPPQGPVSMPGWRRPPAGPTRGAAAGRVTTKHGWRHRQQFGQPSHGGSGSGGGSTVPERGGYCSGAGCKVLLYAAEARGLGWQPQQPDVYVIWLFGCLSLVMFATSCCWWPPWWPSWGSGVVFVLRGPTVVLSCSVNCLQSSQAHCFLQSVPRVLSSQPGLGGSAYSWLEGLPVWQHRLAKPLSL